MKKVLNFIKQGWFLSLIGILLLALVISFVTPMLIHDESTALIISIAGIALLIIGWMGTQLLHIVLARKKNEEILDSLQELDDHQSAVDEEVDILKERLSSAINELKNTQGGKKKGADLYQLPWYIIIGPPASGKTTLLKNSRLKTALSEKFGREAIAGVGGTRYCDWWFAEEAVLLDTAGRYTTQDSHAEADKQAWLGFLKLLKKNRARRPLNGILIAISMDELLTSQNIHQHASEIRKRLQELYDQFNLSLPVYLMFTKTDLLAGFSEFFDDLDKDARAQVWGTTFTHNNKARKEPLPQLKEELNLLEEQLKNKLILKLEKEIDLERRKKIYTFPEQFRSIKHSVDTFVNEVFAPSRYQHKIFLRGVYFTSAEQTGSPVDKLLNSMANTFGFEPINAPNARSHGKSFFIDNLLQKVVFPESELAGLNPSYEKRQRLTQWGSIGLAAIALFTGIGLWFTSYLRNDSSIEQLSTNFAVLEETVNKHSGSGDLYQSLDILNKANHLFQQDPSTMATFGLSQQSRLKKQEQLTYNEALQIELLPHVLRALEAQLRNNTQNNQSLFNALKAYLLFKHPEYFKDQKPLIQALMGKAWEQQQLAPEIRQQLEQHLDALLAISPAPSLSLAKQGLDNTLIESARNTLAQRDVSELIYEQVKAEIRLNSNLPEFVLAGSRGIKNLATVFERKSGDLLEGIDGLYTYKGYQAFKAQSSKHIKHFLQDNWVLGDYIQQTDSQTISEDVGTLYLTEYQTTWEELLFDLKIITPDTLEQASEILTTLTNQPSPLKKLLQKIAEETHLSKSLKGVPAGSMERALKEGERLAVQATGRTGSTISNIAGSDALTSLAGNNGDDPVSVRFEAIRDLAEADSQAMSRIIRELDSLGVKLRDARGLMPQEMLTPSQQQQLKKSLDNLQAATRNLPPSITGWLLEIRKTIIEQLNSNNRSIQNSLWNTQVYSNYERKIRGKYPLAGQANGNEIPLGDFSEFFGPNGTLDQYFQQHLAKRVDRSQIQWKSADSISPVSQSALKQLQLADKIRSSFFPNGKFGVKFNIKPESVPPNVTKITLNISGNETLFNYPSVPRPSTVQWPGKDGAGFVSLDITTAEGANTSLSSEGQWALIDMFTQKGRLRKINGSTYQVVFPSTSGSVVFKINVAHTDNLFNAVKEIRKFRCPTDL